MKDVRGLYYYPYPANKKTRMYVRRQDGEVFFRLWSSEDSDLWEKHGWVPHGAIRAATRLYRKTNDFDPSEAYDLRLAEDLLEREGGG